MAGRARDMDAVREASSVIDALGRSPESAPWAPPAPVADLEPLTTDEIARLISAERAHRQAPTFGGEKAPRKRRRQPRRPQRDLFDDFLAFLEKNL